MWCCTVTGGYGGVDVYVCDAIVLAVLYGFVVLTWVGVVCVGVGGCPRASVSSAL